MSKKKKIPKASRGSLLGKDLAIGRVTLTQKAVFAKHMAVMLSSGLTIWEALDISHDSAKGKLKAILERIKDSVEAGNTFADSLAKYPKVFRGMFVDVVRAGETSGTLAENLQNIATQLKKEKVMVSKVKSAMAYPTVILVAAFILALTMAYYVLPQITPLFAGLNTELPATTRAVIWFSNLMREDGLTVVLSALIGVPALIWMLRQKFSAPFVHWVAVRMPVIKVITRSSNLGRFTLTLGTLLKSGLPIDQALHITKNTVSNFYFRRALERVERSIEHGSSLAAELQKHEWLFPKLVISMIHVGERSGELDDALLYLADFYEEEVENATKALTTALEPMLLVGIGIVVAILALAIITPIYEITGNIRR